MEIQQLRDGMRTHGRMWSKVSRYVGTNKTAGHCKSFFQEYQSNQHLQLGQALEEHVRNKVRWWSLVHQHCVQLFPHVRLGKAVCNLVSALSMRQCVYITLYSMCMCSYLFLF